MQRQQGLTLLELMVVLLIIGLATAGVALAMRDGSHTQLEREAQRLVAQLEAARAQSRTSGQTWVWQPSATGYAFYALPRTAPPTQKQEAWLQANTQASIDTPRNSSEVVLGPEPVLAPVQISLRLAAEPNTPTPPLLLRIGTDGLKPFEVLP